jgi:alkylresorcinol/alkylpyrone synthase
MSQLTATHLAGIGCASPDYLVSQQEGLEKIRKRYGASLTERSGELLEKFFRHPGIRRRRFATRGPGELFEENPDERMERFTRRATELSAVAVRGAMERAGARADEVSALVVNTCTGYVCPGISNYLLEELGLPSGVGAYDLVGAGCGGAVPNLELASSLIAADPDRVVLSVSVEICSATFQMGDDPSLLISNALFADGAAAAVLRAGPPGLELVESRRFHEPRYREDIRYVYREGELHNQLSPTLPVKSARVVGRLVGGVLEARGLAASDIPHWALHPGGARIIDRLEKQLGLTGRQVAPVREVLRDYGNLSSVSVWFVLRRILREGVEPGDLCVMLAFGAGLSAHLMLLRAGDPPVP